MEWRKKKLLFFFLIYFSATGCSCFSLRIVHIFYFILFFKLECSSFLTSLCMAFCFSKWTKLCFRNDTERKKKKEVIAIEKKMIPQGCYGTNQAQRSWGHWLTSKNVIHLVERSFVAYEDSWESAALFQSDIQNQTRPFLVPEILAVHVMFSLPSRFFCLLHHRRIRRRFTDGHIV